MKNYKNKIIGIILLVAILITTTNSLIIPNKTHPLQMSLPIVNQQQTITFRFSLAPNSSKLLYSQVIGVKFPKIMSTLSFDNDNRFTCSLLKYNSNYNNINSSNIDLNLDKDFSPKSINMRAIKSTLEESTTAYCMLDDYTEIIDSQSGNLYEFTLHLNQNVSLSQYQIIENLSLFFATSNTNNKVILDGLMNYGSLGVFKAVESFDIKHEFRLLDVKHKAFKSYTADPNEILLNQYFDALLSFNVGKTINKNSVIILKVINTNTSSNNVAEFVLSSNVYSSSLSLNNSILTKKDDDGNFQLNVISRNTNSNNNSNNNELLLSNFNSDIIPGNYFLDIRNCFSGNKIGSFYYEILIFHPNSYIVNNYSRSTSFEIKQGTITIDAINHPEGFDMQQGSIWPLVFELTFNYPGENDYLVIQQTNTIIKQNKFNFLASTCDFSINTNNNDSSNYISFSSTFGERPICHPLRKDMNFPNRSEEDNKPFYGSAIVFKINKKYFFGNKLKFSVYGYAEFCGKDHKACFNYDDCLNHQRKFEFEARLYKNFDMSQSSEDRTIDLIAISDKKKTTNKCYNNFLYNTLKSNPEFPTHSYQPYSYIYEEFYPGDSTGTPTPATIETAAEKVYFREFTDFDLGVLTDDVRTVDNKLDKSFYSDVCNVLSDVCLFNEFKQGFLTPNSNSNDISVTSNSLKGSYFNVKVPLAYPKNIYESKQEHPENFNVFGPIGVFALPLKRMISENTKHYSHGRLGFKASGVFLEQANRDKCYLSWAHHTVELVQTPSPDDRQNIALSLPYDGSSFPRTKDGVQTKNLLYYLSNPATSQLFNNDPNELAIDYKSVVQAGGASGQVFEFLKHFKLVSVGQNVPNTSHYGYFGLINSCIKYKLNFPEVKSQYQYFEFSIYFEVALKPEETDNSAKDLSLSRYNRFFKFVGATGLIDITSITEIDEIYSFHYINFPFTVSNELPSYSENSICLFEINYSAVLKGFSDYLVSSSSSNSSSMTSTLWVSFYKIGMLDTDVTETSSTYPVYAGNMNFNNLSSDSSISNYNRDINSTVDNSNSNNSNTLNASQAYLLPSAPITSGVLDEDIIKQTYDLQRYFINTSDIVKGNSIYPRTTPYQFVENNLLITNIMPDVLSENILIPTLCPVQNNFSANELLLEQLPPVINPSITFVSSKAVDFNSINSISAYIVKKSSMVSTWEIPLVMRKKFLYNPSNTAELPIYTSVRFYPYTSTDDNSLYIVPWSGNQSNNGNPGSNPLNKFNCSAFLFYVNERISITNYVKLDFKNEAKEVLKGRIYYNDLYYKNNTNNSVYNVDTKNIVKKSNNFYVQGKPFNKFIFFVRDSVFKMPYIPVRSSAPTVLGIKRPNLFSLVTNNNNNSNNVTGSNNDSKYLKVTDLIGFNCISKGTTVQQDSDKDSEAEITYDNNYFTNLNFKLLDLVSKKYFFVLDFTRETTLSWSNLVFSLDKTSESIYKNDFAGNMKLQFQLPNALEKQLPAEVSTFEVETPQFRKYSICAVQTDNQPFAYRCTNTSNVKMACSIPPFSNINNSSSNSDSSYVKTASPISKVYICCYGVDTSVDSFKFPKLTVGFSLNKEIKNVENHVWKEVFSPSNQNVDWSTDNSNGLDFTQQSAEIKSLLFSESTIGSFSSMLLTISLNREVVRNSLLTVNGNFKHFIVTDDNGNYKPVNCGLNSTSSNNNSNNSLILLESCIVDFTKVDEAIKISFKNELIKCNMSLPKEITLIIFPVKNVKVSEITDKFSVKWVLLDKETGNSLSKFKESVLPSTKTNNNNRESIYIEDLTLVKSITPRIPGVKTSTVIAVQKTIMYSEFRTFSFDKLKFTIENTVFEADTNSTNNGNVMLCYFMKEYQPCSFSFTMFAVEVEIMLNTNLVINAIKSSNEDVNNNNKFGGLLDETNLITEENFYFIEISGLIYKNTDISNKLITETTESINNNNSNSNNSASNNNLIYSTLFNSSTSNNSFNFVTLTSIPDISFPLENGALKLLDSHFSSLNTSKKITIVVKFSFIEEGKLRKPDFLHNYPFIVIRLPSEFAKNEWIDFSNLNNNSIITSSANQVFLKDLAEERVSIEVRSFSITSNYVYLQLSENLVQIDPNFLYFEVLIDNIFSPEENEINKNSFANRNTYSFNSNSNINANANELTFNNDSSFSTLTFQENLSISDIWIGSSDNSYLYKTRDNLNYFFTSTNNFPLIKNEFLKLNKGFFFGNSDINDLKKWKIIISSEDNSEIIVKPGRYINILLNTVNLSKLRTSSITEDFTSEDYYPDNTLIQLSVNQRLFETIPKRIDLYTVFSRTTVLLGTACTTRMGYYLINLENTYSGLNTDIDNQDYLTIYPKRVFVDNTIGEISVSSVYIDLIFGGSQELIVSLSEPTFNDLVLNYLSDSENNATASLSKITIPKGKSSGTGVFSVSSLIATGAQKFNSGIDPACFKYKDASVIFNVNAEPSMFPDFYSLQSKFQYVDPNTSSSNSNSSSLNSVYENSFNSVVFVFTPDIVPLNLYCVLLCYDLNFPSDDELVKIFNTQLDSTNTSNNNNVSSEIESNDVSDIKYKKFFIATSTRPSILKFNNLKRSNYYKLKCVAETPVIEKIRSRVSVSYVKMSVYKDKENTISNANNNIISSSINNDETVNIKSKELSKTLCLQFDFEIFPNKEIISKIIDYCQSFFFEYSDCYTCIDSFGNIAKGIKNSSYLFCSPWSTTSTPSKNRVLLSSLIKTKKSTNSNNSIINSNINSNIKNSISSKRNTQANNSNNSNTATINYENYFLPNKKAYFYFKPTKYTQSIIDNNNNNNNTEKNLNHLLSICVIQQFNCAYNAETPFNYYNLFNQFMINIDSTLKINSKFNSNVSLREATYYEDDYPVSSASKLLAVGVERVIDSDGYISLPLRNSENEEKLICYFKTTNSRETLTTFDIYTCSEISRCGSAKVNKNVTFFDVPSNIKVKFEPNIYYIWATCSLDIPNALFFNTPAVLVEFKINPTKNS